MYLSLKLSPNQEHWLVFFQPRMVTYERTMNERGDHIKLLKDKMNTVEDEIFQQFCSQIGVENIR